MTDDRDDKLVLHGEAMAPSGVNELAVSESAAAASMTIQAAAIMARKFPRNEDAIFEALMRSCKRTRFADSAEYSFKRGRVKDANGNWVDNFVTGASVKLAREAKRLWGNIRTGIEILVDEVGDGTSSNPGMRKVRGFAWDLQTNTFDFFEDSFRKLVQRKVGKWPNQVTEWVVPNERDLRELTSKQGAICVRNAILAILPPDLIDDARDAVNETLRTSVEKDPEGAKKKVILGFSNLNIDPPMLEEFLGHPLKQCSPADIVKLRGMYASIRDNNSSWSDYVSNGDEAKPKDRVGADDVPKAKEQPPKPKASDKGGEPADPDAPWPTITKRELADLRKRLKALRLRDADLIGAVGVDDVSKLEEFPRDRLKEAQGVLETEEKKKSNGALFDDK